MPTTSYGFTRTLPGVACADARRRIEAALKTEGFGILTEIDVQATFKAKLGVAFPHYEILGACNPTLAHLALTADPGIGLLLPCNVVVSEDATGQAVVSIMDPEAMLRVVPDHDRLEELMHDARERLQRALANA